MLPTINLWVPDYRNIFEQFNDDIALNEAKNYIICTLHQILSGLSNQGGLNIFYKTVQCNLLSFVIIFNKIKD
jgi:hypothetical protein